MHVENKNNNFGFLRLLLASLVIVAHSAEILDQNRSREILSNIFGTITFGELAIDGFFLISGYLILKSFLSSSTLKSYLMKRVLRIYPGFIAASLFCIFVLIPLSGEFYLVVNTSPQDLLSAVVRMLTLDTPQVKNTQYATLNGAMWSIWLEFVCYLCIPIVYLTNFNKPKTYFMLALMMMIVFLLTQITDKNIWLPYVRLDLHHTSRLMFGFLVGGLFYLLRDKIVWSQQRTVVCVLLLLISLNFKHTAEIGLMTFGAYLLFNFALNYKNKFLNSIGAKVDVSYGVYLYAWPVQVYVIKFYPQVNLYVLMLVTLIAASVLGYVSWTFIERPFMQLKGKLDLNIRNATAG
ncbi:MAG: acyltransferase [Methylotenera sp.]|nr:acyltransferase [Methylotenera sp.]